MLNQYLTVTNRYNQYLHDYSAKLILTDFFIQIIINQYLTVQYQYLVHIYIVKAYLTGPYQYSNNSYRQGILRQTFSWIRNGIETHNPLNSTEILSPNNKAAR